MIRTQAACLAFGNLPDLRGGESAVVALRGAEPNSILAWLREMDSLRQAMESGA